jgi:hypothetical protein
MQAATLRCSCFLAWSAILLSLPLGQAADAQTPLPPDLISPNAPHEVANGASASVTDLAIFAWQEFTALNWPSVDPATTGHRGRPDTNSDFLTIKPGPDGSYPLLVWQDRLELRFGGTVLQIQRSAYSARAAWLYDEHFQQSRRVERDRPVQHVCA